MPSSGSIAWLLGDSGEVLAVDTSGALVDVGGAIRARAISAGSDGALWLLPAEIGAGDVIVRRQNGHLESLAVPAPAQKIAGGPDGTLWMLSVAGEVFSVRGGEVRTRHSPPGIAFATEISVGLDGMVWIVSTATRFGGRIVRRLSDLPDRWYELPAPASATRISIGNDGMAWTLNAKGEVWRLHPRGGGNFAECQVDVACTNCAFSPPGAFAREISAGADGTVWVLASRTPDDLPGLFWLADPKARRFAAVQTQVHPIAVAAGVGPLSRVQQGRATAAAS
jgi:streptogramin lyase